jgi:hypothetical protein
LAGFRSVSCDERARDHVAYVLAGDERALVAATLPSTRMAIVGGDAGVGWVLGVLGVFSSWVKEGTRPSERTCAVRGSL